MEGYSIMDKLIKTNMYALVNKILLNLEKSELDMVTGDLNEVEKFLILDFWINLYLSTNNISEKELIKPIIEYYRNKK